MYANAITTLLRRRKLILLAAFGLCAGQAGALPVIQHWQAPSGAQVYFVEDHTLPMLDVSVNFPAGSGYDTRSKSGLAALTQDMLDHGAKGMSEDAISRSFADIGAQLGGDFDRDRASVTLRTLSRKPEREKALKVLADVLEHPTFPQKILSREKQRTIASLREAQTRPEAIADKTFARAIYGKHPYGLPPNGEVSTVRKLSRADLLAFYRSHYGAKAAVVVLVGDISRSDARAIAQKLTAKLPAGAAPKPIPPVAMQIKPSEQRIAHPASQSHILIGMPGVKRKDADYFPLYVGNYILGGGGFVSRLMKEVREKRGMAYSVYSYFFPLQQAGMFQIGLQTRKSDANKALAVTRDTLKKFVAEGPSEAELQAAKDNIIGGFALRTDSNRKILAYLSMIGFYHLPLTYLDDFPKKVKQVTVAQIHSAFKRRVHPGAMATVIVGAPGKKAGSAK